MLHPYAGLVVLEKTKNALCKMTVAEVEELLLPFSEAKDVYDPEPDCLAMVVDAYWISKAEAQQEKIWAAEIRGRDKSGVGSGVNRRKAWTGKAHAGVCPGCKVRRPYDPAKPKPCLMCKCKDPPTTGEEVLPLEDW